MIAVLVIYLAGILLTRTMIINSNVPDVNPQPGAPGPEHNPSNLSPAWALIWPIFWLKTLPVFIELEHEKHKKE